MPNETTIAFILDKTAPIFNKQGYVGTSMSDLTTATGLTKGAIYGNFQNKEALAIAAFKYNVKLVLNPLGIAIADAQTGYDKLRAIVNYHRSYMHRINQIGGCPIVNVGVDSKHVNSELHNLSKTVSFRMIDDLRGIVELGFNDKSIKPTVDPRRVSKTIYSIIEGGIFMTMTHNDDSYLDIVLDHIEDTILINIKV